MSKHVVKEISAYIDGEARHPGRIEAHLNACSECHSVYQDMMRLSVSLKSLPNPEVRPEFTTRVMAHVREAAPVTTWLSKPWLSFGLALAAVVVTLAGAWMVQPSRSSDTPSVARNPQLSPSYSSAANQPDDTESWLEVWPPQDGPAMSEWAEDAIDPIAQDEWKTPLIETWGPNEDLDSMLLGLDEQAEQDFRALLWLYAQDVGAI